jgi:Mycothiol maleylpyruvate isomerase N-terminal domain.
MTKMTEPRADALAARLEKGRQKTFEIFDALTPGQWQQVLYKDPNWQVRQLLAHFVSSEEQLLALAQDVAAGGPGAPQDYDYDSFNAHEQSRLDGLSVMELRSMLDQARQRTIAWVRTLDAAGLDKIGHHPVLGQVTVETLVLSIYGHQLIHMRDLSRLLGSV